MYIVAIPATITCGACAGLGTGALNAVCASCDGAGAVPVVISLTPDALAMFRASLASLPPTPLTAAPIVTLPTLTTLDDAPPVEATPYSARIAPESSIPDGTDTREPAPTDSGVDTTPGL